MQQGSELLVFCTGPNERIDGILAGWAVARHEAATAGFDLQNVQQLSTQLLRALRMPPNGVVQLLQHYDHRRAGTFWFLAITTLWRRKRRTT